MEVLYFVVAIFATTIGSIGGMSGGLIIKPTMDAVSGLDVSSISFMSSCTVLTMSFVNAIRNRNNLVDIQISIMLPLAIGGSLGGILGKVIFSSISADRAMMQSLILAIIYLIIYFYVKCKNKLRSLQIRNKGICFLIGCVLGTFSAFLGIGGGPINMAVLFYFIGSTSKMAAKQSLFLILFSQLGSFCTSFFTGFPEGVNYFGLVLMMIGGSCGAILGGCISKKLSDQQVDAFFVDTLVGAMLLNIFNIGRMVASN